MKTSHIITFVLMAGQLGAFGFYEPFNYSEDQPLTTANPNWVLSGTTANDTLVALGNLSIAGLAPSLGNSITNGGVGAAVRIGLGTTISSDTVYYSFGVRINSVGATFTSTTSFIASFVSPSGTYASRLQIKAATGGYQLGVAKAGQSTVFDPTVYTEGQTLFIVGSYTFDSVELDLARLWINPSAASFGGATAPDVTLSDSAAGGDLLGISQFTFRQNTAANTPADMTFDELRIGSSWAEVTPVPEPSILALGALSLLSLSVYRSRRNI